MTVDSAAAGQRTAYWRRFSAWARRVNLERKLAIVLSVGAVVSGEQAVELGAVGDRQRHGNGPDGVGEALLYGQA